MHNALSYRTERRFVNFVNCDFSHAVIAIKKIKLSLYILINFMQLYFKSANTMEG